MGVLDVKPATLDVIGVPVFFIQDTILENLGDGTVRIAGCILQNGLYIPQYFTIMTYATLRRCAGKNALMASELIDVTVSEESRQHH